MSSSSTCSRCAFARAFAMPVRLSGLSQCEAVTRSGARCSITSASALRDVSQRLVSEPLRCGGRTCLLHMSHFCTSAAPALNDDDVFLAPVARSRRRRLCGMPPSGSSRNPFAVVDARACCTCQISVRSPRRRSTTTSPSPTWISKLAALTSPGISRSLRKPRGASRSLQELPEARRSFRKPAGASRRPEASTEASRSLQKPPGASSGSCLECLLPFYWEPP